MSGDIKTDPPRTTRRGRERMAWGNRCAQFLRDLPNRNMRQFANFVDVSFSNRCRRERNSGSAAEKKNLAEIGIGAVIALSTSGRSQHSRRCRTKTGLGYFLFSSLSAQPRPHLTRGE